MITYCEYPIPKSQIYFYKNHKHICSNSATSDFVTIRAVS